MTQTEQQPETQVDAQPEEDTSALVGVEGEMKAIKAIRKWLDRLPSDESRFRVWGFNTSYIQELARAQQMAQGGGAPFDPSALSGP